MRIVVCDRCGGAESVMPIDVKDAQESIGMKITGDLCKNCRARIEHWLRNYMTTSFYNKLENYIRSINKEEE